MRKKKQFKTISQEEQDRLIVAFYRAQERDLLSHELNEERFERMLQTLPPGKWRDRIQSLLDETRERKAEVESIIAATEDQLPPPERLAAIVAELDREEKAARGGERGRAGG